MRDQLERLVAEMVDKGIKYEDALKEFERRFFIYALHKVDGNLCQAADLLGIHRNTLSRKVSRYRISTRRRPSGASPRG